MAKLEKLKREDFSWTKYMSKKNRNECSAYIESLFKEMHHLSKINEDQRKACVSALEKDDLRMKKYKIQIESEIQHLEKEVDYLENDKLRFACKYEEEKAKKLARQAWAIICFATAVIAILF